MKFFFIMFQGANEPTLSVERLAGIVGSSNRKSPTPSHSKQFKSCKSTGQYRTPAPGRKSTFAPAIGPSHDGGGVSASPSGSLAALAELRVPAGVLLVFATRGNPGTPRVAHERRHIAQRDPLAGRAGLQYA